MAITYTSKYHAPEDPGGIIGEILNMGAEFTGPAQDVLLGWTLRLDETQDPATAARAVLVKYGLEDSADPEGACGDLVRLLRETASFSQARLNTHMCRPESADRNRRRGGRKARHSG